jgi:hypothetical protein
MTTATTAPTRRRTRARPSRAARRFGYVVAIALNTAMLYAINVWPGWDVVPFLTGDTVDVLDAVNASIVVTLAANTVYLFRDPPRVRALGDLVTTVVGLVVMVVIWRVFPLDVSSGWETVARVLLAIGIVGSAIAIVTGIVRLVRPRPTG